MNVSDIKFHNTEKTLVKIEELITNKQKGMYLRFGDGDIVLACGGNDEYQSVTPELRTELQEALSLNDPNIMKTLPLLCKEFNGFEEGMSPGKFELSYEWCLDLLHNTEKYWGDNITDVYSTVALAFAATDRIQRCISFLSFLRNQSCSLLIGNKDIPQSIKNILFGPSCNFIPTPINNSYYEINNIEQQCLEHLNKQSEYNIVITSMGCSGRALQKRLWKKCENIFLFDFGSLMDGLCGWNTRAWINISNFNNIEFLKQLESH